MTTATNTDDLYRTWGNLVNKETGTSLGLAPGESAEVGMWSSPDPYPALAAGATEEEAKAWAEGQAEHQAAAIAFVPEVIDLPEGFEAVGLELSTAPPKASSPGLTTMPPAAPTPGPQPDSQ